MSRTACPVASLTAVLILLAGCGDTEDPDARAGDDPTTTGAATSDGPESASTESVPEQASSATDADDPVTVTLYDADFAVDEAGDLSVVETLTLDYPVDDLHGIFRNFGLDREAEGFEATLDGGETPVEERVVDDERVYRIGDPAQTLAVGQHVVRIEYGFSDVLTEVDADVRSFDWQLIPDGWAMDISAAQLTVQLPAEATAVVCTVGQSDPCDVSGAGSSTLVVTTGVLEDHTPVVIEVELPRG